MNNFKQGNAANLHGKANEADIRSALVSNQFREIDLGNLKGQSAINRLVNSLNENGFFETSIGVFAVQVVIGTGIHRNKIREDFLIMRRGWPDALALAARHQYKPGSATKKLEHLYAEISECYPCRAAVLLEGPAHTQPVIDRAQEHIQRSKGKVAIVFCSVSDFRRWLTNGAQYPEFAAKPDLFN